MCDLSEESIANNMDGTFENMHPDDVFNLLMKEDALLFDEFSDFPTEEETSANPENKRVLKRKRKLRKESESYANSLVAMADGFFKTGDYCEASKFAMQAIRLEPCSAGLAYKMLGEISDMANDAENALKWYYLAAIITKNDVNIWTRCAELSGNDYPKLTRCYNNILRICPDNKELQLVRFEFLKATGNKRRLIDCYRSLMHCFAENDQKYAELFHELTTYFYDNDIVDKAADVLMMALKFRPDLMSEQDMINLLDLLIAIKKYSIVIEVANNYYDVYVEWVDGRVVSIYPNVPISIDLTSKLIISLSGIHSSSVSSIFVEEILKYDITAHSYHYHVIAEALFLDENYFLAEIVFDLLTQNSNTGELWHRLGTCSAALNKLQKSVYAFENALELKQFSTEISMELSTVQQRLGFSDKAIQSVRFALSDTGEQLTLEICELLLNSAQEFCDNQDYESCYHALRKCLFSHLWPYQNMKFVKNCLLTPRFPDFRNRNGEKVRKICGSEILLRRMPGLLQQVWKLFKKVAQYLLDAQYFQRLAKFACFGSLIPSMTQNPSIRYNLVYMTTLAYTMTEDMSKAFSFLRTLIFNFPDHVFVWNYFCRISLKSFTRRFDRFCLRQRNRSARRVLPLHLMTANFAITTGRYKFAYLDLIEVLPKLPNNPLVHLLLAICILGVISSKFTTNRHHFYITMMGFFNSYKNLRGDCQEVYYNIGRAMQQLNLRNIAIHYYERCLAMPPVVDESFDLRPTAAFNLTRLLKNNGDSASSALVKYYYSKYLCV